MSGLYKVKMSCFNSRWNLIFDLVIYAGLCSSITFPSGLFSPKPPKRCSRQIARQRSGKGYDSGFESHRQCPIRLILLMIRFFRTATDCRSFLQKSTSCCGEGPVFPMPIVTCFSP